MIKQKKYKTIYKKNRKNKKILTKKIKHKTNKNNTLKKYMQKINTNTGGELPELSKLIGQGTHGKIYILKEDETLVVKVFENRKIIWGFKMSAITFIPLHFKKTL